MKNAVPSIQHGNPLLGGARYRMTKKVVPQNCNGSPGWKIHSAKSMYTKGELKFAMPGFLWYYFMTAKRQPEMPDTCVIKQTDSLNPKEEASCAV